MICPKCGDGRAVVKDTRDVDFAKVRRFRECDKCGYRFKTIEVKSDVYENIHADSVQLNSIVSRIVSNSGLDSAPNTHSYMNK